MIKERELITKIEKQLPELLPTAFKVGDFRRNVRVDDKREVDLVMSLINPVDLKPVRLAIEAKSTSRLSTMLAAAYQAKEYAERMNAVPMVASTFIGERTRTILKKENVNYLDLAGNYYLSLPNLYAEKVVNKNPFSSTPPLKNIFAQKSSRIARAMLIDSNKAWRVSALSNATGVSIGQTHNVLEAMAGEHLVKKDDLGRWILSDPTALLNAWKQVYPTYRVRKYSFFSYRPFPNFELVSTTAKISKLPYALGFFSGADKVAPFIRGLNKVQFYTDEKYIEKWREALDLKEVQSGGNIEVYVPYDEGVYYGLQELTIDGRYTRVVSNVQLYMDLFNNPARGEEAAEHLRKEKIGF